MLDINKIRNNTEEIKASLLKRMDNVDLESIIKLDDKRRKAVAEVDEKKAEGNKIAKGGKPTPEQIEEGKKLREEIKVLDESLNKVTAELNEKLGELPNIVAEDVVAGDKENNKIIKTFGKERKFDFEPKDNVELATIH